MNGKHGSTSETAELGSYDRSFERRDVSEKRLTLLSGLALVVGLIMTLGPLTAYALGAGY